MKELTEKDYEKALKIATEAHEGQKRWNGDAYITHPIRVAEKIWKRADGWLYRIVAILHDVVEDTSITIEDLKKEFPRIVTNIILILTRHEKATYSEYIRDIKSDVTLGSVCNCLAINIKIADIKDNLRDLKPGQRREKYELALLYLEGEKNE